MANEVTEEVKVAQEKERRKKEMKIESMANMLQKFKVKTIVAA